MAKKEDRKKQKKQRKLKKEALKAKKWAARNEFPQTEIVFDGHDEAFMLDVEEVIHSFDYGNDEHCPESVRTVHRLLRKIGLDRLEEGINSTVFDEHAASNNFDADEFRELQKWALYCHLPDWIFSQLPDRYTKSPLPDYFFQVVPNDRRFVASFQFLPRLVVGAQSVWHSPLEPTVTIRGQDYKVGFTKHVFERACKRMSLAQPVEYFGFNGITSHFRSCVYFEHVLLGNGQDALRLFAPCLYEIGQMYMVDVANLRPSDMAAGPWFFVIGYCPVELSDAGFAIGLTLLFPGYNNTPEDALVKRTRKHDKLDAALRSAAYDNSLGKVFMEKNLQPLRWYHHYGVPQVIRLEKPLYGIV